MMGDVANAKYITNIVISHADKKGFWTTDYVSIYKIVYQLMYSLSY